MALAIKMIHFLVRRDPPIADSQCFHGKTHMYQIMKGQKIEWTSDVSFGQSVLCKISTKIVGFPHCSYLHHSK